SESVWHWAPESACCSPPTSLCEAMRAGTHIAAFPGDGRHMHARPPQARPRCTHCNKPIPAAASRQPNAKRVSSSAAIDDFEFT
ncbi:MAG: hypothetical protein QGH15_20850, partial [Kiritimatiellia bacterium]|nr:hypothetical protein [Kiritimatiellia bacterium]